MSKTYECRYCYKTIMKSKGQICAICHKLFGKHVITIVTPPQGDNNEKTSSR